MMNKQKATLFYQLCRLCLEGEGICDVFETENLLQDIYTYTGVIIFVSDKLPHKVCIECVEIIKNANKFRMFVKRNDVQLRSMFNSDGQGDNIKTCASHTPAEAEYVCEEVQSAYFKNGDNEDISHTTTEPNTKSNKSFLGANPVVVQTISLRKDLFYSSSVPSCCESPSPTETEFNPLIRLLEEKVNIKKKSEKTKMDKDERSQSNCGCSKKNNFSTKTDPYIELLEKKVEIENKCEKSKIDEDESTEYICGICSKYFETYKKFYLHQRLHNKKLVCPLHPCGKKFATKGDLEKHVRTHTGEKPYVCGFCNKGFAQRVSLRYHVINRHPMDPAESDSSPCKENAKISDTSYRPVPTIDDGE